MTSFVQGCVYFTSNDPVENVYVNDKWSNLTLKGHWRQFLGQLWKAKRHILIRGNPKILVEFHLKLLYQFSETIIKRVWLPIARMEINCYLKTSGWCFQVLLFSLEKSPVTDYGLFFLWENHLISFFWRSRNILCKWKDIKCRFHTPFRPKT